MKLRKDKGIYNKRYYQLVGMIAILMAVLAVRLFIVTVIQHDEWSSKAEAQNTKSIFTTAPRGNIYDRNGQVLATNKQVFTVAFNSSSLKTEDINNSCLTTINLLLSHGEKISDKFPITISEDGTYSYTYKQEIDKWLVEEGFEAGTSASQAFKMLRTKYGIDPSINRYEALEALQTKHNLNVPISVKSMTYTYDTELKEFLTRFGFSEKEIDKGISAQKAFSELRKTYKIDSKLSDADARKIFIIRNEIIKNGFTRYNPVTVAKDVSAKTIAYIEEASIPGVSIESETERYYPNGAVASHVLGYMGSISDTETGHYVDKLKYNVSDLIGKDGIEASFEEKLHGTPGETKIRVNSSGEYVETVSKTDAKKGKDVYLTLDLDLQKVAESSMKKAIDKIPACESGAVVAIDVETGNVLAMASYPNYDPNIFAKGISTEAWESVQAKNPRDALSPAPLYNNATKTSVAPGSTFKPITAITALECGLNPDLSIYDGLKIDYGGHVWACSNYNDGYGSHGNETLEWGLGNSCNFYFYCIATGKNWNNGASLGYSEDIGVDKILNMAQKFGLGQKTGIEIPENVTPLASSERKMKSYRSGVWNALYANAHTYWPAEVADNYDELKEQLDIISDWIYENPSYDNIIKKLGKETKVEKSQIEAVASMVKFDYFIQAQWTLGDLLNISIGQGDNAYTPLQMANYIATIGNKGVKNQVSIVGGVEDEGTTQKAASTKIQLKEDTIPEVIKGMKRVCKSGTLAGTYKGFPIEVAGKTGTAENQGILQPADELEYIREHLGDFNSAAGTSVSWEEIEFNMNAMMEESPERYPTDDDTVDAALIKASGYKITMSMINKYKGSYDYYSWTVALAPANNPKIAVVAMLIQGGKSFNAAPITKDVIAQYLDAYGENPKNNKTTDQTGINAVQ